MLHNNFICLCCVLAFLGSLSVHFSFSLLASFFYFSYNHLVCSFQAELDFCICHFSLVRFDLATLYPYRQCSTIATIQCEKVDVDVDICILSKVLQTFFMVINFDGCLRPYIYGCYTVSPPLSLDYFFVVRFRCSFLVRSFKKYGVFTIFFTTHSPPRNQYHFHWLDRKEYPHFFFISSLHVYFCT